MIGLQVESTQALEENIVKYQKALTKLHIILSATNRISMMKFSEDNKLSKSLSTVLSRGGIIVCMKKGKFSEWNWNTIRPSRQMAIKVLQELSSVNPKRKIRGGKREGSGRKTKSEENKFLESYTVRLLFGLIKINVKLNYKK